VEINHRSGGSPPDFGTLDLGRIDVDSADVSTNRWLSSSSRSTSEDLASRRSHTRTLKSGRRFDSHAGSRARLYAASSRSPAARSAGAATSGELALGARRRGAAGRARGLGVRGAARRRLGADAGRRGGGRAGGLDAAARGDPPGVPARDHWGRPLTFRFSWRRIVASPLRRSTGMAFAGAGRPPRSAGYKYYN